MENTAQRILVIHAIDDGKTRYLTAKKLSQLFNEVPFSEWKSKLDSGGDTVVMRSENEADFDPYRRSLEMLGAETAVIEQKVLGGAKVY
jgi:hypothetical protein